MQKKKKREPLFDVFLCHNSADKPAVERLARGLIQRGLRPWLDEGNLVPGAAWQETIEKALDRCNTCAVFLGPSGTGPWQNEEMRVALDRRFHQHEKKLSVIPVLLPGAKTAGRLNLPSFLLQSPLLEFRSTDDKESLDQLVKDIKSLSQVDAKHSERVKWVLVLDGVYEDFSKARAEAVAKHIRELLSDSSLKVKRIDKGSINIHFEFDGDEAELFERLISEFKQGKFTQVEGLKVLDIRRESGPERNNGAAILEASKQSSSYSHSEGSSIFVSYSHADAKSLQDIQRALTPLIRSHRLSLWDDRCIKAGDKWRDDINRALGFAKSAILLVSQHFLASNFIVNNELPPLLFAAEGRGLRIFWIAVSDSLYTESPISAYQCLNDPSRPLDSLSRSKRNAELVRIAKQIRDLT
jgi:hypothetical protein